MTILRTPCIPHACYGQHSFYRDWESYSEVDIQQSGALHYAAHPSTLPLLVCYAVDDGPIQHYRPGNGEPIPEVFFTAAKDPDWTSYAHNNPFDSAIEICQAAPRFGWPLVPIERQVCTMALAQYHNYPGALEKIADRLKLPLRKDKEGKKLMRRLTRPQRRPDGTWGFIEPTPEEWEDFIEYAGIDTLLVRDVRHAFKPLPEIERRLYPLDHKINHHGPTIDVALATQCCELVKVERAAINSRLCEITDGLVTAFTKVKAIAAFVNARGHNMVTLDKRAVAAVLAGSPDPVVREVLELRQAGANSAAAKYEAVLKCVGSDQRIRGLLRIYGTITGRWTSNRFNIHNLPREDSKTAQAEIEAILSGDLEQVRKFGPPLDVLAKAVRGLVIGPIGKSLLIGDFSMIEPRLISWYSEEGWQLKNFREFDRTKNPLLDDYRVLGARMGNCSVDPTDEKARRRGKTAILAFGYGGSVGTWRKLVPNEPRSDVEIKQEVNRFREIYPAHTAFMFALERQALTCVASRQPAIGKRHSFTMEGDTLLLHLASGRTISYPNARIEIGERGNPVVVYHDPSGDVEELWYGALMAHLISGTARDLLAHALLNLDAAGFEIILHVHDEVVAEVAADKIDLNLFERCLLDMPDWAAGLPLAAEVRASDRYIKADTPIETQADAIVEEASIDAAEAASTGTSEPAPKPAPPPKLVPKPAPKPAANVSERPEPAPAAPVACEPPAASAGKHNGAPVLPPAADDAIHEKPWRRIPLADLIGEPLHGGKILCPFHDDHRPSCHIYADHFYCFVCEAHGDQIDWLREVEGLSFQEALDALADWTPDARPAAAKPEDDNRTLGFAHRLWGEADPIAGTLAEPYLAGRHIDVDALPETVSEALRFHPECPFNGAAHPCLIALFRDVATDAPAGIHRIALTTEAQKIERRMLGRWPTPRAVKLWPAERSLVVGEGIETVLAAATRVKLAGEPLRPAWALCSAGGVARMPVIDGVERLVILVDRDEKGETSAAECARVWFHAGRRVIRLRPRITGTDFNDVIRPSARHD